MKNKKGFTLVELLSVIVILALISVMATAGIITLSNKSKENMYCAKLEMISSVARDYAVKYEYELNRSSELFNGYKSLKIKVSDLINNGKLETDKDNTVINPLDDSSLNEKEIILYLKNNRINAYIDSNNICEN